MADGSNTDVDASSVLTPVLCDHPPPRREMQKPRGRQYDVDGIHAPLPSVPIRAECNPVQNKNIY